LAAWLHRFNKQVDIAWYGGFAFVQTSKFVPTRVENCKGIEQAAHKVGLLK
jgi:hypothetical protein